MGHAPHDRGTTLTAPDHRYAGLTATTWDLHRDTRHRWDDAQTFFDLVREYGQPALDLGCGTGRVVLDFAKAGIDIDGVDNAPEMLAICRAGAQTPGRAPGLFEQSLEALELPRRYGAIFGSSSVFQLVTDPVAALAVLKRIHAHLKPGGVFYTPFAFDWREGEPLDTGWQPHFEKTRPEDGATIRASTREWREPPHQWWHTEEKFEVITDGKIVHTELHRRSPEGRWYTQAQAVEFFRAAGFTSITLLSGFTRKPAKPEDRLYCVLGVKS